MLHQIFNYCLGLAFSINAKDVGIPKLSADNATLDRIFGVVYTLLAFVAVFFVIRGALLFVTSGSNPGEAKKARETVLYALIAVAGSTLVFALIQFIIGNL